MGLEKLTRFAAITFMALLPPLHGRTEPSIDSSFPLNLSRQTDFSSDLEKAASNSSGSVFDNIHINQDYISLQFSFEEVALDVLVSDEYPKPMGYEGFIEAAKEKYGNKLVLVTNSTFWEIGGIEKDGEKLTPRNSGIDKSEFDLVFSLDRGLSFIDSREDLEDPPDLRIPGFVALIKDGKKVPAENYNHRDAITPKESRRRAALSVTNEGFHFYYDHGTLSDFTDKLILENNITGFKVVETGNLDAGGESFCYLNLAGSENPRTPQKKNPESNAVLVVYKK